MSDESTPETEAGSSGRVTPRSPSEAIQPEPAPPPPERSKRARRPFIVVLSGIFTFLLLMVIAGGAALYIGKLQFESAGPLDEAHVLNIPRGEGMLSMAQLLEREGIIDNAWLFLGGVVLTDARGQLKAGEYLFPAHASMRDIRDILVEGRARVHRVTIPEGYTSQQIVDRLEANDVLVGEISSVPSEGSLLPDTYQFSRGDTRQQMINRMQRAQLSTLQEIWDRRADDLPIETPEELVNLASIVEKETGVADERPRVAGVFVNRLRRGMMLQSDPTILYGLYGGEAFVEPRTITREEMDTPNDYNTYQIDGLPPTPINNPGRAAMEAVANPSRTDDLYFVADGTGGHAFAETLDEHNRNVARWREIERERREAREAAEEDAAAEEETQDQDASAGSVEDADLTVH